MPWSRRRKFARVKASGMVFVFEVASSPVLGFTFAGPGASVPSLATVGLRGSPPPQPKTARAATSRIELVARFMLLFPSESVGTYVHVLLYALRQRHKSLFAFRSP